MGARNNQTVAETETDVLAAEEESLTTNKSTSVSPKGRGKIKTTIRWLSKIHNQRIVKEDAGGGGKK